MNSQTAKADDAGITESRSSSDHNDSIESFEKDAAAAIVSEHEQEVDHHMQRRVLRKIDLYLMPWMWIGFLLTNYDKSILGSAVLFGMTKDLSLSVTDKSKTPPTTSTERLSWATSMFYFGMLAGLYPMTYILQRFRIGRVLGTLVVLWGAVCMLTAAVTSWQGLYAQRFFLGVVESVIPTGFMCIVSGYYRQEEQALRQSWWVSGAGGAIVIGGALNYGFAQITSGSLARWQYIYLLAGSLTVVFGLVCFLIPNSAVTAKFLSAEERVVAVERLRKGQTGVRCQKIKGSQMREAVLDIKIWIVAFMMAAAYTVNGAVTGFGPLIVSTFGWSTLDTTLLQFPIGGIGGTLMVLTGYLCSRVPNIRLILLTLCCLPVIAGCAIMWKSTWYHRAPAPVVGYSMLAFFAPVVSITISIALANVAGATKKTFAAALTFVGYCVGNIIGPQLVRTQSLKSHYHELWLGLIICYCILIVLSIVLYFMLRAENKRREALGLDEEDRNRLAFQDLTDKENLWFRYVL